MIFLFLFFYLNIPTSLFAAVDFKTDSVVKVFATRNTIDYSNPWQSSGIQEITGSGCIIQGNRILTNAHVVNQNTFIQVGDTLSKEYIEKLPLEQNREIAHQLNRRTEFRVLSNNYVPVEQRKGDYDAEKQLLMRGMEELQQGKGKFKK